MLGIAPRRQHAGALLDRHGRWAHEWVVRLVGWGESLAQALHGAGLACKPVPGKGDRRSLAVRQVEHGAGKMILAVWDAHC